MPIYGYTHAKLASVEKYIAEHDLEALILESLKTMHLKVCQSTGDHVRLTIGPNKGKCRYCLKKIAVAIEEPIAEPIA